MGRGIHRLSAVEVKTKTKPGHYADGGGLYLQVSKWGTKSWVFKFTLGGRTRGMGLGPIHTYSLAEARAKAGDLRKTVAEGHDPIEERKEALAQLATEAAPAMTFAQAVERTLEKKEGEFRNDKHRKQWRSTLDTYASPVIGAMDVGAITTQDILRVLSQETNGGTLWEAKTETASRLRGRIEAVLSQATVAGFRTGDNPARWAGNLKELLPKPSAIADKGNQPALAVAELPAWFAALRKRDGISARAIEFLVLTAARSGEIRGMVWSEVHDLDGDKPMWVIPAQRMKAKREHRVPLSSEAVKLLMAVPQVEGSDYVFPAVRGGSLSDMALSGVMRRMQEAEVKAGRKGWLDPRSGRPAVPHGLRSTFRDWAAEKGYERDMAEIALAHTVGSEVERAYRRSDVIERRRAMMAAWAATCRGERTDNVVQLHAGAV
ncbi:tyrosine-type recombinase/integrase [Alloyangia pacifica]|uniref:tyrosine-type recombinase/integrase n=1 Tax=Alloyangia pacifica TaxID=311180 RepID=UPI001CD64C6D|nr:site-specific integrase [Alloyangia pacifica]MCA0996172.1 tyrosine-type recombinase/integrase [Alloyangia pacifica]